jgi:hypothetical protein
MNGNLPLRPKKKSQKRKLEKRLEKTDLEAAPFKGAASVAFEIDGDTVWFLSSEDVDIFTKESDSGEYRIVQLLMRGDEEMPADAESGD